MKLFRVPGASLALAGGGGRSPMSCGHGGCPIVGARQRGVSTADEYASPMATNPAQ